MVVFVALLLALQPTLNSKTEAVTNLNKASAKPKKVIAQVQAPVEETPTVAVPPPVVETPQAPPVTIPSGGHEDWMAQAGINQNDWSAVDYIISHESGWNFSAVNAIGATGLCQSLPAIKMASAGADYLTNPVTQLQWCSSYAVDRYGSWQSAYNFWVANRWW